MSGGYIITGQFSKFAMLQLIVFALLSSQNKTKNKSKLFISPQPTFTRSRAVYWFFRKIYGHHSRMHYYFITISQYKIF